MKRILVTGATGNVGRQVVSQLLATDVRVRALIRNPDAAGLPPEVERVRGDLTVPATLDGCLDGVDAMFLVWSAPPGAALAAMDRMTKQARRIVFLSSPHRTPHPFFQASQPNPVAALHAEIERLIEASGLPWTFLRPGMFAANALSWWAPQIRALLEAGHDGAEYVLTGPQSLSQLEQVATIGDATGRSLRFEEMSPEEARRELLAPPSVVNMLLEAWAAAIGLPAFVTSTVAEITGTPARTFRDWVTDHAAEFRP